MVCVAVWRCIIVLVFLQVVALAAEKEGTTGGIKKKWVTVIPVLNKDLSRPLDGIQPIQVRAKIEPVFDHLNMKSLKMRLTVSFTSFAEPGSSFDGLTLVVKWIMRMGVESVAPLFNEQFCVIRESLDKYKNPKGYCTMTFPVDKTYTRKKGKMGDSSSFPVGFSISVATKQDCDQFGYPHAEVRVATPNLSFPVLEIFPNYLGLADDLVFLLVFGPKGVGKTEFENSLRVACSKYSFDPWKSFETCLHRPAAAKSVMDFGCTQDIRAYPMGPIHDPRVSYKYSDFERERLLDVCNFVTTDTFGLPWDEAHLLSKQFEQFAADAVLGTFPPDFSDILYAEHVTNGTVWESDRNCTRPHNLVSGGFLVMADSFLASTSEKNITRLMLKKWGAIRPTINLVVILVCEGTTVCPVSQLAAATRFFDVFGFVKGVRDSNPAQIDRKEGVPVDNTKDAQVLRQRYHIDSVRMLLKRSG